MRGEERIVTSEKEGCEKERGEELEGRGERREERNERAGVREKRMETSKGER